MKRKQTTFFIIFILIIVATVTTVIITSKDDPSASDITDNNTNTTEKPTYANKPMVLPDNFENKTLVDACINISTSSTLDDITAILGESYEIANSVEEQNYMRLNWHISSENPYNAAITFKDNKCESKEITLFVCDENAFSNTKITQEKYNELEPNMSFDAVQSILDEGTLYSIQVSGWNDNGKQTLKYVYGWKNDNGALIITFDENSKVKSIEKSNIFEFDN